MSMATIDLQDRPRGRRGLSAWYSKLLADQKSSGLSVAEYAEALGLTPTTLYHWKRRLSGTTALCAKHSEIGRAHV